MFNPSLEGIANSQARNPYATSYGGALLNRVRQETGEHFQAVLKIFDLQHADLTSKDYTRPTPVHAELEMAKMGKFESVGVERTFDYSPLGAGNSGRSPEGRT